MRLALSFQVKYWVVRISKAYLRARTMRCGREEARYLVLQLVLTCLCSYILGEGGDWYSELVVARRMRFRQGRSGCVSLDQDRE